MRLIWFWFKLVPYLPWIYFQSRQAERLPYEARYPILKRVIRVVVGRLKVEIKVSGRQNIPLESGFLFVANHQGTADPFIFVEACDVPVTAVSKAEGRKIPFLSAWYEAMEVIYLRRDSLKDALRMSEQVKAYLLEGRNVLIFPEGTRSKGPQMGHFKPGALKGAIKAQAPIIPIALVDTYIPLDSRLPKRPVAVKFGQPIHYEEYSAWSSVELAGRLQERIAELMNTEPHD